MNTDTAQIYRGTAEIEVALSRGEPVVPVSDYAAQVIQAGHQTLNRAARRQQAREARRAAKAAAKAGR